MRNEDIVRRGGKVQWPRLLCFASDDAVCVHSQLLLLLVCLCVYVNIALLPVSWNTTLFLQFWHGSVAFTLVFRSVPC